MESWQWILGNSYGLYHPSMPLLLSISSVYSTIHQRSRTNSMTRICIIEVIAHDIFLAIRHRRMVLIQLGSIKPDLKGGY